MICKRITLIVVVSFTCSLVFSQTSGHLKFGLLEFQMLDTLADPEIKTLMEKRFEKSLSYDVYFNQDTILEIRDKEELNISYMTFYDSKVPNVIWFFLRTPEGNYFVRDSTYNIVKKNHYKKKDKKAMKEIMVVGDPEKDDKIIVGFNCNKVTMLNPIDRQSEYVSTYLTSAVPGYTSSLHPFSELFPGFPLETTFVLDQFKVRYGAVSFEPIEDKEIFAIDTSGYTQITYEKMKEFVATYLDL